MTSLLLLSVACDESQGCCLNVASDGDFGSLQGPGSFNPNAVLALLSPPDAGDDGTDGIVIELDSSTPAFACADETAGDYSVFPDSGVLLGSIRLWVFETGEVKPGTFDLVDPIAGAVVPTDGGVGWVALSGATSPPSTSFRTIGASLSGTATLTKVGDEWAGSFTATMLSDVGGEQSTLSGSFDTRTICYLR